MRVGAALAVRADPGLEWHGARRRGAVAVRNRCPGRSIMSPFRFLSRVALLAATAACAAAQRTAVGGPTAGCYSLMVADWDRTVAAATGLPGLPNYVALDPAASGPRGHRLTVPAARPSGGPDPGGGA